MSLWGSILAYPFAPIVPFQHQHIAQAFNYLQAANSTLPLPSIASNAAPVSQFHTASIHPNSYSIAAIQNVVVQPQTSYSKPKSRLQPELLRMSDAKRAKVQEHNADIREAEMTVDARIMERLEDATRSYRDIAREFGVNHSRVKRITEGVAAMDGKGRGRRSALSEMAELHLVTQLQELVSAGKQVTGSVIRNMAEAA